LDAVRKIFGKNQKKFAGMKKVRIFAARLRNSDARNIGI